MTTIDKSTYLLTFQNLKSGFEDIVQCTLFEIYTERQQKWPFFDPNHLVLFADVMQGWPLPKVWTCKKSLRKNATLINYSELHYSEVTSYKSICENCISRKNTSRKRSCNCIKMIIRLKKLFCHCVKILLACTACTHSFPFAPLNA